MNQTPCQLPGRQLTYWNGNKFIGWGANGGPAPECSAQGPVSDDYILGRDFSAEITAHGMCNYEWPTALPVDLAGAG
jgi:hypothetical protein